MEFYFGFKMREDSFYSVTRIDDRVLESWMILLYCLDEIQTYEELISTSHEGIIGKMVSWVYILVFESFYVQFLFSEVSIISTSKLL